jgi:head-tail adaptor
MVASGERRDRVSVQVRTEVPDGHDGFIETWSIRHARWSARVRALTGRDLETARQVDPRVSWEVIFGWWRAFRDDLDGGRVRLLYHPTSESDDDITLEVVTPPVDVEGRKQDVLILCRELA